MAHVDDAIVPSSSQPPPLLLKTYGTLHERSTAFVTRVGGQKRQFPFGADGDGAASDGDCDEAHDARRKRARRLAQEYLRTWTLANKVANTYVVRDDVCLFEAHTSATESRRTFTVRIDAADLERVRDRVWWVRVRADGAEPMYVYTSGRRAGDTKRLLLADHLSGHEATSAIDGDVLNCCRSNLSFVADDADDEEHAGAAAAVADEPAFDFDRFCFDGGPHVPKYVWTQCKRQAARSAFSERHVARMLSRSLAKFYIAFPLPTYSDAELIADVVRLERLDTLVGGGGGGGEDDDAGGEDDDNDGTMLPHNDAGQRLCKQFMADAMLECGYRRGDTDVVAPSELWRKDAARERLCLTALRRPASAFNAALLWQAASLSQYVASNFPPASAKTIYDRYACASGRVLDLCSGWGGRLLGFWFSDTAAHYVGVDPNPRLQARYARMLAWLARHCPRPCTKTWRFAECGAETDAWSRDAPDERFDLVFTSPPYFDREVYHASDAAQSCHAFASSYAAWRDGFLFAALRRGADATRVGGRVVLNVANTARCPTLVDDALAFMTGTLQLEHEATLELPMSRRPNSHRDDRFEPVLVLRRTL